MDHRTKNQVCIIFYGTLPGRFPPAAPATGAVFQVHGLQIEQLNRMILFQVGSKPGHGAGEAAATVLHIPVKDGDLHVNETKGQVFCKNRRRFNSGKEYCINKL